MPFDIQYDSDKECVFVIFTGSISMSLVRKYITELLPVLEKTGCRRLLSDCTHAEIKLSSREIMQFPKLAAASPLTARLKRAVLSVPGTSGYELYETISKVMGQPLRVFTDREEAMEWLMGNND